MKPCKDCENDLGIYNFSLDCCLTRYVLSAPDPMLRKTHFDFIGRRINAERMAVIKLAVDEHWKLDRAKVLNFGRVNKS